METDQGLIKLTGGLLTALGKGGMIINVMPKEILVMECVVAGTSYRKLDTVEAELQSEVKLEVKREPENQFDKFACALWFGETKIGYIPKEKNEVIARLADAGKSFFAILQAKGKEGNWLKLDIKVYLRD